MKVYRCPNEDQHRADAPSEPEPLFSGFAVYKVLLDSTGRLDPTSLSFDGLMEDGVKCSECGEEAEYGEE